jgi:trimeric autotransporter adhesin
MRYFNLIILAVTFSQASSQGFYYPLSYGFDKPVRTIFYDSLSGAIYAGGEFEYLNNPLATPMNGIARWNGSQWDSLGSGIIGHVLAINKYLGNIIVGGGFTSAGSLTIRNLAKWDGNLWSSFGNISNGAVYSLIVDGTDLYIGGIFDSINGMLARGVARYDGVNWHVYPPVVLPGGGNVSISSVALYDGELYVGGVFDGGQGRYNIARFDGTNWVGLNGGVSGAFPVINSLSHYDNKLVVAGRFLQCGSIACSHIGFWDGQNWSSPGTGIGLTNATAYDVTVFDGDLYVGGNLQTAGGIPVSHLAKWDGISWTGTNASFSNGIYGLISDQNGLYIGGAFRTVNGDTVNNIVRYGTTVGFNEPTVLSGSVYPNPSAGNFTVDLKANGKPNEIAEIIIRNLLGNVVYKEKLSLRSSLVDIKLPSFVKSGFYTCTIISGGSTFTIKFVLDH